MTDLPVPAIPAQRFRDRLAAAREIVKERNLAALFVGVGPDLRYLTGFVGEPMERLTLLVVPCDGPVTFVTPRLEAAKAAATPVVAAGDAELLTFDETEDSAARVADLLASGPIASGRGAWEAIAISDRLWAMHVLRLQAMLPGRKLESAGIVLRELRQIKDADETRLLGLAAAAADRAMQKIASGPLVGRTEADVSRQIRQLLVDEGHDVADFAIVGSGPNSASPHHDAGGRTIAEGEPVVLDIGGLLGGYGSDTTRTIWIGGEDRRAPEPEFAHVYEIVREAQARATRAVKPGVPAEQIDAAARAVIADAGYGEFFTHRVGHGIGLEVHEDPYMVSGNDTPLQAGMAFSVEPGIYLPGRWGVRLENIVVCGDTGPNVLNRSPLELQVVRG